MGNTAPDLIVPSQRQPTFWNRSAAAGASIGMLVGLLGSAVVPGASLIGLVGGTVAGGAIGKREMERDLATGKVVGPPSFWNKDTAIGAAVGNVVGLVGGIVVGVTLLVAGAATLETGGWWSVAAIAAGGAIGLSGSVVGTLAGGVIGGKRGEKRLAGDYQEAVEYTLTHSQGRPPARAQGQYTVSLDEARLLESRLLENTEKSMVEKLAQKDPRYADRAPT